MSIGQDIKEKTSYQQTCYRCKEYKHNDKSDEYKHTEQKINTVLIWCKKKKHILAKQLLVDLLLQNQTVISILKKEKKTQNQASPCTTWQL